MFLVTNVILNTIDVLMFFLLTHALTKRIPIFTVKRVLIGIAYGFAIGTSTYLLGEGYTYRIISMLVAFLMVYLMVKLPFPSTFLIYIFVWLVLGTVQLPIALILQLAQLENIPMFLVGQLLTLVVVIPACKFLPFNRWHRFIEEHVELKLLILMITFIAISIVFYWNFQYSLLYILYFGVSLTFTLIAIYCVGSKIVYLRYKVPLKANNDYHIDLGMMVKAYKEENHQEIKRLNKVNQSDNFKLQTEGFQLGKATENIVQFIKNKQKLYDRKDKIQYDIDYDCDHPVANTITIVKMLSILLDNAIENGTDKPIIIELTVTMSYIQLSVRNEFTPDDSEEMSRIFTIEGYTTKKKNQRGYGLTNLHYDVKNIGGKIMTTHDYSTIGKGQYLNITITV